MLDVGPVDATGRQIVDGSPVDAFLGDDIDIAPVDTPGREVVNARPVDAFG